jgi:hypothetical protein
LPDLEEDESLELVFNLLLPVRVVDDDVVFCCSNLLDGFAILD